MSRIALFALLAITSQVSATLALAQIVEKSREDASEKAPAAEERSLDVVVAEYVILWDGKIVTWDEMIEGLREMRERAKGPVHPNFHFTHGAIKAGYFQSRQQDLFKVYEELFEPIGMSLGSISPRASPRYDAIKGPDDLVVPPEKIRKGIVRAAGGRPVKVGIAVLVPEDAVMPVMLTPDLTLRDRWDEVWSRLDNLGRFDIPVTEPGQRLVILSPVGFAVADVPQPGQLSEITLTPSVTLDVSSQDQSPQELGLTIRPAGLPQTFPGFSIYEVKIGEKPAVLRLPPGQIAISRTYDLGNGTSRLVPGEQLELRAGERRKISMSPPAEPDGVAK